MDSVHQTVEGGPAPRQWAHVQYVAKDGSHVDLDSLYLGLADLFLSLDEIKEEAEKAGQEGLAEQVVRLINFFLALAPDMEAMEPGPEEPDPVAAAQAFLASEFRRAQEVINIEGQRQRLAATEKEAFILPEGILVDIVGALKPRWDNTDYNSARAVVEQYGWRVCVGQNPASIAKSGEPLRKLRDLIGKCAWHHLTSQVLELIELSFAWADGTSYEASKGTGKAPVGVLYPYIQVEMLPIRDTQGLPKEFSSRKSALVSKPLEKERQA
ncbi:hypothetical protein LJC59_06990 [Desulfovibrio sp. OttesenSCG-928-A18]|nr:hypothetical protein [Desulfovibrio sp. OttesenSCG-928-A18]